ncbi:hypothetical protein AQ911_26015 [Burkholderia pseudomallei]|nr:hypothetical protein AQ911_26015 [Burkholderia pseudomallei]ONC60027.1 hypothetical protein AQ918_29235 [Burkholderia pseudomallei]
MAFLQCAEAEETFRMMSCISRRRRLRRPRRSGTARRRVAPLPAPARSETAGRDVSFVVRRPISTALRP